MWEWTSAMRRAWASIGVGMRHPECRQWETHCFERTPSLLSVSTQVVLVRVGSVLMALHETATIAVRSQYSGVNT